MLIMKKERKYLMLPLVFFALMIILTGCSSSLPETKISKLAISFTPNPVTVDAVSAYEQYDYTWRFAMKITETGGVRITVTEIEYNYYNENGQSLGSAVENAQDIINSFGTNYISGNSFIEENKLQWATQKIKHYAMVKVVGIDNNGNSVEATKRIDFII